MKKYPTIIFFYSFRRNSFFFKEYNREYNLSFLNKAFLRKLIFLFIDDNEYRFLRLLKLKKFLYIMIIY